MAEEPDDLKGLIENIEHYRMTMNTLQGTYARVLGVKSGIQQKFLTISRQLNHIDNEARQAQINFLTTKPKENDKE